MKLSIWLHEDKALVLEADPREHRSVISCEPAAAWVSSGWDGREQLTTVLNWLDALLPETEKRERWMGETSGHLDKEGNFYRAHDPETLFWVYAHPEFPGAVKVARDERELSTAKRLDSGAYSRLDERDVDQLLLEEMKFARHAKGSPKRQFYSPTSSLAGMRPKISLTAIDGEPDEGWLQGEVGQMNSWILKVEHSAQHLGEAGVESICQKSLSIAGIRSARTLSRVIKGTQCLLSERADRQIKDGCLKAVHQEDFRQAAGTRKFREVFPPRKEWPFAYQLLTKHAPDVEEEHRALTKFLAATWLLAHSDLHRGNLGFHISHPDDGPKRVRVAPAYDVSSAVNTKLDRTLEFPIAEQGDTTKISVRQWMVHAKLCKIDEGETLDAVNEVAGCLADAFVTARNLAALEDENVEQATVDRRCEKVLQHINNRAKRFSSELAFRRAKLETQAPGPSAIEDAPRADSDGSECDSA